MSRVGQPLRGLLFPACSVHKGRRIMARETIAEHAQEGHYGPIYVELFFDTETASYGVRAYGDTHPAANDYRDIGEAARDYGERVMALLFLHFNLKAPAVTWLHGNQYN